MAAINAAWELIGDPAARQAFDRARAAELRQCRRAVAHGAPAPDPTGRPRRADDPRPPAAPPTTARRPDDRLARLDLGAVDPGRRLRRVDAQGRGPRRGGPATGPAVRDRPQLRPLRRLVARRGRPPRPRVHRVARSGADRAQLPPGDRRDPALERPAPVGRTATPRIGAGSTAAARRSTPGARHGSGRGRDLVGRLRRPRRSCGRRPGRPSCPGRAG